MKASDIYECYLILDKMRSKNLPISMNLVLGQNYKTLREPASEIENKRNSLINEYANVDANNNYTVPAENSEEFTKLMNELLDTEINVNLDKIQMDTLNRCGEGKYDALSFEETNMIHDFMLL